MEQLAKNQHVGRGPALELLMNLDMPVSTSVCIMFWLKLLGESSCIAIVSGREH